MILGPTRQFVDQGKTLPTARHAAFWVEQGQGSRYPLVLRRIVLATTVASRARIGPILRHRHLLGWLYEGRSRARHGVRASHGGAAWWKVLCLTGGRLLLHARLPARDRLPRRRRALSRRHLVPGAGDALWRAAAASRRRALTARAPSLSRRSRRNSAWTAWLSWPTRCALGPPYRFHGELMHGALRDRQENAITWHLIHVLEKLERGS